ncbi:CorA family divalent cation transporter, partial [Agathobacter rectalis]|uniref:CorA family divalent cation transporter n=1 Tax=Agathobacter rectalis TaxID=39491 RepID=UPI0027D28FF6
KEFKGHSLSVSDVVVLHQDGQDAAHFVDSVGFREVPEFLQDLMSTVIDNRLNNVMKSLTIITLIMAIPTVISGIFGMNVSSKWVPLATTAHGFMIIIGV